MSSSNPPALTQTTTPTAPPTNTPTNNQPVVNNPPQQQPTQQQPSTPQPSSPSSNIQVCSSASADPDGDGYGWENSSSCVVDPNKNTQGPRFPTCVSASADSDGDGYGWENNASCVVGPSTGNNVAVSTPPTAPATTPEPTPAPEPEPTPEPTPVAANNAFVSSGLGRWGNPISLPSVPVSAANLPNGKILTWTAYNKFAYQYGVDNKKTYTTIFDPNTGTVTDNLVTNTKHDMFCPGASMLANGSIMVTGGSSMAKTSVYNPANGSWSAQDTLNIPRAYNSNTTLQDGSVLTLGGSWAEEDSCRTGYTSSQSNCRDKAAEVWNPVSGWRVLPGISANRMRTNDSDGLFRSDNHMWLFTVPGNKVLHVGPSKTMHLLSTNGNGSISVVGKRSNDGDAMNGNAVMYDIGKILTVGGAPDYEEASATNNAFVVSYNGSKVTSKRTDSMKFKRAYHNSVVLPNGEVIVIGGQPYPVLFSDAGAVYAAELWNPVNGNFRTLATMSTARTYHSMVILLQDGRVLAGGGGLCGDCTTNHPDVEIFTPPYLLNQSGGLKARPKIESAPNNSGYGNTINVRTNKPVSSIVLVRTAAVTHSVNNDQRRVPLKFSSGAGNNYNVSIPSDRGIAPPGNYFLFALDQSGTPSVAKVINIQ